MVFAVPGAMEAGLADPLLLWVGLAQMAWACWLNCLAVASTPPWIIRGE